MYGRKTTKLLNMVRRFLGKGPSPASASTGPGRGHRAEASKDQDLARKVYTPVQQAKRIDQGVAGRAGYAYDAGRRLHREGRFKGALDAFKESLELFRQVEGSEKDQGDCLHGIGAVRGDLGDYEEALAAGDEALELFGQVEGTQNEQAYCRYNMAISLRKMGSYEEALGRYDEALTVYGQIEGVQYGQIVSLENSGVALEELGCYEEALEAHREALRTCQQAGSLVDYEGRLPVQRRQYAQGAGERRPGPAPVPSGAGGLCPPRGL